MATKSTDNKKFNRLLKEIDKLQQQKDQTEDPSIYCEVSDKKRRLYSQLDRQFYPYNCLR